MSLNFIGRHRLSVWHSSICIFSIGSPDSCSPGRPGKESGEGNFSRATCRQFTSYKFDTAWVTFPRFAFYLRPWHRTHLTCIERAHSAFTGPGNGYGEGAVSLRRPSCHGQPYGCTTMSYGSIQANGSGHHRMINLPLRQRSNDNDEEALPCTL
jgi:hypothetical protein